MHKGQALFGYYIKENYRKFPQGSHVIFYLIVSQNNIQIIRILHRNMDVPPKFGDL
jgi:toxin ParE1/3/4